MQGISTPRGSHPSAICWTGLLCTAMFPLTQFEHAKSAALEPANKIQEATATP